MWILKLDYARPDGQPLTGADFDQRRARLQQASAAATAGT